MHTKYLYRERRPCFCHKLRFVSHEILAAEAVAESKARGKHSCDLQTHKPPGEHDMVRNDISTAPASTPTTLLALSLPGSKPCDHTVVHAWAGVKSPPWGGAADVNRQKVSSKAKCSSWVQEASPKPRADLAWCAGQRPWSCSDPCPCPDMNWSNWKSSSTKLTHIWQTSHSKDTVSCQSTPALILHGKIPAALC